MLTTKEQLEFCKKCEKKASDLKLGIVCSLTNAKPDFGDSCPDFVIDPTEEIKQQIQEKRKAEEKEELRALPGQIIYGIVVIVIVVIIAVVRLSIRGII